MILNGLCVLGLAYSGCNLIVAVVFFCLSLTFHGTISTGCLSSTIDIAPNFAGINMGIISTFVSNTGFISPIIVGYITFENQSVSAWQHIYEICAAMLIGCGVIYIWLNDTAIQPWNNPQFDSEQTEPRSPADSGNVNPVMEMEIKNGNVDGVGTYRKKKNVF
jgi:MFS family permease